jgi:hypothetical protein
MSSGSFVRILMYSSLHIFGNGFTEVHIAGLPALNIIMVRSGTKKVPAADAYAGTK